MVIKRNVLTAFQDLLFRHIERGYEKDESLVIAIIICIVGIVNKVVKRHLRTGDPSF